MEVNKKQRDKLNISAISKAGEIEKYSAEYFKLHGSQGGKKGGGKRWIGKTEEEIIAYMSAISKKGVEARRKLSTKRIDTATPSW